MNNQLTRKQLEIILGYYLFDSKKVNSNNIREFTSRFNRYFGSDINSQNISYMLSYLKKFDSSYTANPEFEKDDMAAYVWNYYVITDRLNELNFIYKDFKASKYAESEEYYFDEKVVSNFLFNEAISYHSKEIIDVPKDKYAVSNSNSHSAPKRSIKVLINSIINADFKCEYSVEHYTFTRKNIRKPYTEGHHLIPLEFQNKFDYNLDVEANVVSLCSNCHNHIHYGQDYDVILKKLYIDRKNRLEKCGLFIEFDDLLKMYK